MIPAFGHKNPKVPVEPLDFTKLTAEVPNGRLNINRQGAYERLAHKSYHLFLLEHAYHSYTSDEVHPTGIQKIKDEITNLKQILEYKSELQQLLWKASRLNDPYLWKQDMEMALYLGADINLCDEQGSFLINYFSHDPEKVEFLLSKGADPLLVNGRGNNTFFNLDKIETYKVLEHFTNFGYNELIFMRNSHGDSIFTNFVKRNLSKITVEEVEFFLAQGFKLETRIQGSECPETIIHFLAKTKGAHKALCITYRKGSESLQDARLRFPLEVAIQSNEWESVASLIRCNSPITPQNFKAICESFPEFEPLSNLQISIAEAVLRSPNSDFSRFHWSRTHFAARCNFWTSTIRLESVNSTQDPLGQTPLHIAVYYNHLVPTFCLLNAGEDPNRKSRTGSVAKSLSKLGGNPQPVDELLEIFRSFPNKRERTAKVIEFCDKHFREEQDDFSIVKNISQTL